MHFPKLRLFCDFGKKKPISGKNLFLDPYFNVFYCWTETRGRNGEKIVGGIFHRNRTNQHDINSDEARGWLSKIGERFPSFGQRGQDSNRKSVCSKSGRDPWKWKPTNPWNRKWFRENHWWWFFFVKRRPAFLHMWIVTHFCVAGSGLE